MEGSFVVAIRAECGLDEMDIAQGLEGREDLPFSMGNAGSSTGSSTTRGQKKKDGDSWEDYAFK